MDTRTAELLLELHASQYQAAQLPSSQTKPLRPADIMNANNPVLCNGESGFQSMKYTIEGESETMATKPGYHQLSEYTTGDEPRSMNTQNGGDWPIGAAGGIKGDRKGHEKETNNDVVMTWAEETLWRGRRPHPTIQKLMEKYMARQKLKRAGSEPPTPPSAIKRITGLPSYGAGKELASGSDRARVSSSNAGSSSLLDNKEVEKIPSSVRAASSSQVKIKIENTGSPFTLPPYPNAPAYSQLDIKVPPSSYDHEPTNASPSPFKPTPKKQSHHCIRDGHRFDLLPVNKPRKKEGKLRTENKIGSRKYKCGKCETRIDETRILMCKVPICGMMVCGECKKEWDVINKGKPRKG